MKWTDPRYEQSFNTVKQFEFDVPPPRCCCRLICMFGWDIGFRGEAKKPETETENLKRFVSAGLKGEVRRFVSRTKRKI
jgi:hypothetical protein